MIRSFSRIPLRRYLHTPRHQIPPKDGSPIRLIIGLAATVAAVTYFSGSNNQRRVLDVPPVLAHKPTLPEEAPENTFSDSHAPKPTVPNPPEPPVTDETPPSISEGSETLEDEDGSSGGAFNPVTGEINWDCPCLGGMAHGPCGPQFREAFSCFVFSEKEPKGVDCVEKFKNMQDCFREHPELYGDEIMDDDEDETAGEVDPSMEASEDAVPPTDVKEDNSPQIRPPSS